MPFVNASPEVENEYLSDGITDELIDALAKGDEVVTTGGMLGKISKIGESYLTVEIASGVEIQVQRGAVVQVLPKGTVGTK